MWVVVVFGAMIGITAFMVAREELIYKDYPVTGEHILIGLIFIGFLAYMIGMILT